MKGTNLLGPIDVQFSGTTARAECHVRASHHAEGTPGGAEWIVAGHYVFELEEGASGWLTTRMTLETFQQTGNTKLLQEATS
jgi:hypothetical protein